MTSDAKTQPKEGDLRVWYIQFPPRSPLEIDVPDLATAVRTIDNIVALAQWQMREGIIGDYSDAVGVMRYESAEDDWWEVDEEEFEAEGLEAP